MEATVDKLESMFQKADRDLDYLSRKLDAEFAYKIDDESNLCKENPKKLLEKLGEIKQEYASIVKETLAIQETQQEAVQFFRSELTTMCDTLMKLQATVGLEGEVPEEQHAVEEMLGLPLTQSQNDECSEGATGGGEPDTTAAAASAGSSKSAASKNISPTAEAPMPAVVSPHERRHHCSEFIDLDQEEFNSVSSLVRGRVKLADVNHIYRILWSRFKEEGDTTPLKPADMFKMGLRVSGQTGEAKLKVLRALKLITISKTGDVTMS